MLLDRAHTDGSSVSHCKIHRVQHLNVSRTSDAPAELVDNNLRSTEAEDDDEAGVQLEMNAVGLDVGVTHSWRCCFSSLLTLLRVMATYQK